MVSAMWETRVQSLGPGDPLEKDMAIHSSIPVGGTKGWEMLSSWVPHAHIQLLLCISDECISPISEAPDRFQRDL